MGTAALLVLLKWSHFTTQLYQELGNDTDRQKAEFSKEDYFYFTDKSNNSSLESLRSRLFKWPIKGQEAGK